MDYNFITPRLATGAALSGPADVEVLVAAGISHVIDLTDAEADQGYDDVGAFADHPAITVLWNPTADDGTHKGPEWFQESVWFGLSALVEPHRKLYTHCSAGVNRGPSTAFAIMLAMGWSYNDALTTIHTARPVTQNGIIYAADAANGLTTLGYLP